LDTFIPLIIFRFVLGSAFGILTTGTSAFAAITVPDVSRRVGTSYFGLTMNIAFVAGALLAFALLTFISFYMFFLTLSLLMSISVLFSLFVHTGEQRQKNVHQSRTAFSLKISDLIEPKAVTISFISGFVGLAYASVLSFVPVFAEEMGLESTAN